MLIVNRHTDKHEGQTFYWSGAIKNKERCCNRQTDNQTNVHRSIVIDKKDVNRDNYNQINKKRTNCPLKRSNNK